MEYTHENGRLLLRRTPEEKASMLRRRRRVEGQVRGLQQMVEDDRYCLDVVQQVNATAAALREISLLEIEDHLRACTDFAVQAHDGQEAVAEMLMVLRSALRR
jgi:DNA-binding FrmR family transcriptional regulator